MSYKYIPIKKFGGPEVLVLEMSDKLPCEDMNLVGQYTGLNKFYN